MADTGLYQSLVSLKDLHIANVPYAHDTLDGTTILLEHNNTIYMGYMMEDCLTNPLQSEYNGIHIDIHPKNYYPDDYGSQTFTIRYDTIITILYDGVLPYIPLRSPTPD